MHFHMLLVVMPVPVLFEDADMLGCASREGPFPVIVCLIGEALVGLFQVTIHCIPVCLTALRP